MSVSVSKQGQVRKKQSILNGTSNGQLLSQIQAQLLKQFQEQELMTQAKSRSGRNTPTETGAVPQTDKQGGGGGLSDKNTGKQLSVVTGKARHSSTRQDNLDCLAALTEVETHLEDLLIDISALNPRKVQSFLHRRAIQRRKVHDKERHAKLFDEMQQRRERANANVLKQKQALEQKKLRARKNNSESPTRRAGRPNTAGGPPPAVRTSSLTKRPHTAAPAVQSKSPTRRGRSSSPTRNHRSLSPQQQKRYLMN